MQKLLNNKSLIFKFGIFIVTFLFLAIIFVHDYNRFPQEGHADEQAFAWAGFSILKDRAPTSWSHFDYPEENVVFEGLVGREDELAIGVKLVRPWFDHAPLYAVLTGLAPYLSGVQEISVFDAAQIRLPSVFFFLGTLIILFLFTRKLYGYWIGLFVMVVFGTVPLFVFGGRLGLPEVAFGFLLTLMMYLWILFEKSEKNVYLLSIGALIGIAGSMKYTGFLLLPLFIYFLFKKPQFKKFAYLFIGLTPFIVGLSVYASKLDLDLYITMLTRQGIRPIGWSGLAFLFGSPGFDIYHFYDGWFIFGLLSVVVLVFSKIKHRKYILWPAFYWMIVVVLTGGQQDLLPWYRFAMYPFLAVSVVLLLKRIILKPDFFGSVLVFGLLLSSRHYLTNAFRPDMTPMFFRTSMLLLFLPVLLYQTEIGSKKLWLGLSKSFLIIFLVISVFSNIRLIYNKYTLECENQSCPLRSGNSLSETRLPFLWRAITLKPLE